MNLYAAVCDWISVCVRQLRFVVLSFCSLPLSPVGRRCEGDRMAGPALPVPNNTPLQRCLGFPSTPSLACSPGHTAYTAACVCGSSNWCRFIRLHINVVSIEPTPAPLVARLWVCLPVAAVTVEAGRARWLRSPQQAYCCPCSHFCIYGSVYLVQALSVCTVINILWLSWITMVEGVCVCVHVCL